MNESLQNLSSPAIVVHGFPLFYPVHGKQIKTSILFSIEWYSVLQEKLNNWVNI